MRNADSYIARWTHSGEDVKPGAGEIAGVYEFQCLKWQDELVRHLPFFLLYLRVKNHTQEERWNSSKHTFSPRSLSYSNHDLNLIWL